MPLTGDCKFPGCDRGKAHARGWCMAHYQQWKKFGDKSLLKPTKGKRGLGHTSVHGYRKVQVNGKSRLKHSLVMEEHLGRFLTEFESVHHKNGDRLDNRLENLELWSRYQPAGQRVEDKIIYAVELLKSYAPELLK